MLSTPDLCDEFPDLAQWIGLDWRHYGAVPVFAGQVATVRCYEDNSYVAEAVKEPGNQRVLVVDGGGSLRRSLLGDQLASAAVANGWSGIVINGAVRDVEIMSQMNLGVLALRACPVKTLKQHRGERDVPVELDGIVIRPGMWLYADLNGVIVSKKQL